MANFSPLKAGGWAFGEILTSAQMNQLNADFPFAMNGRDGGAYTPSDNFTIQTPAGKEIALNGLTLASLADGGGSNFSAGLSVQGTLGATAAVIAGALDATTVNANFLNVADDVAIGGALTITGALTVGTSATTLGGNLAIAGSLSVTGGLFALSGQLAVTGKGSFSNGVDARIAIGLDTPGTHLYKSADWDMVIGTANTGSRTYRIDDTGLVSGQQRMMWFVNYGTQTMFVQDPTGSMFTYGLEANNHGTSIAAMLFVRVGNVWAQTLRIYA